MRVFQVAALVALLASACSLAVLGPGPDCPAERVAEWEIAPSSLVRELAPAEAERQVVTGSLPIDAIRDRWEKLRAQWQPGDRYWRYAVDEDGTIHSLGGERGIVLMRECRQIGSVATDVQAEVGGRDGR